MTKEIELLSPARDLESGIIAINNGADALYIGATKFGARKNAANSINDIEQLISYAHKFNSKVYIALNTLLFDRELEEAQQIANLVYNAGADALIIQDMGLLEIEMPPIPLHASTQTHNFDLLKIKFLKKVGFERVILARELSLTQIKEIKENTTIELETFIHGSLCVSFSGQCYLSHFVGNRSANRGECAQPCRLPYNLTDIDGNILISNKHLLSLKDLNLTNHIPELINAGVTSLKIEGRLKDNIYIANVVSHYRKTIDNFVNSNFSFKKSSSGKIFSDFTPDIEKSFNRGYTDYFFVERTKEITSFDTPKSIGKKIATVSQATPNYTIIDALEPLSNGDGICYFDKNGDLKGTSINKVEDNKIYTSSETDWEKGTILYRNFDITFEKQINSSKTKRKINCSISISQIENNFQITAIDEDKHTVINTIEMPAELAKNADRALEMIKQQFSKSGDTIFNVEKVEISINTIPFFTASQLNEIRRNILTELEEKRDNDYKRNTFVIKSNNEKYPYNEIDYNGNITNIKAEEFYKRHNAKVNRFAPEKKGFIGNEALMTTKHCIKYSMGWCKKLQNYSGEALNNLYLENEKQKLKLEFDCVNCVMKILK